ncbi:MAG: ABC transporter substrate-binding protein [bacterium]|nr:ABC transporter substrate-binding protein [bacterium]
MRPRKISYRLAALAAALALVAAACAEAETGEADAAAAAAADALAEAQAARSEASAADSAASAADAAAAAADAEASAAAARAQEAIAAAELAQATAEGNEDAVEAARAALAEAQDAAAAAQAEAAAAQAEAAAAQAEAEEARAEAEEARAAAEEAAAEAEAAAAPDPPPPPPPPPEPEPVTFTMIFPAVPSNVDPAVYQGRPTGETTQSVVSTLVRYVPLPAGATALQGPADLQPELAESWTQEDSGSYVFTLREALSPAGNHATASDVLWTFQRGLETDFITPFLLSVGGIDRENPIEVIDDRTFRLVAPSANSLTLPVLTWYGMGIIDSVEAQAHATDEDPWAQEWMATNSASYGAYQVESMIPGEEIRLTKNPNYWNAGSVAIENVVMRAVPDAGNRMLLVGSGEVDFVGGLTFDLFQSVVAAGGDGIDPIAGLDVNLDKLSLNTRFAPFDDVRVRQAISLAIDRDALIAGAYAGLGKPGLYPISTAIPQPDPPTDVAARHDPEAARALLAEAGLADGFDFTLSINPSSGPGPYAEQVAVLIQDQLRDVGIGVNIDLISSPADFNTATRGGELEAWLFGTRPLVNDVAYFLLLAVGPMSVKLEGYGSEAVDDLLGRIVAEPLGPARDALLSKMQSLLASDVPYVPLVETVLPWVHLGEYGGVAPNPLGALYLQDVTP